MFNFNIQHPHFLIVICIKCIHGDSINCIHVDLNPRHHELHGPSIPLRDTLTFFCIKDKNPTSYTESRIRPIITAFNSNHREQVVKHYSLQAD